MATIDLTNPALTVALALVAGLIAQSVAQHLRMPGIITLLVTGAVLGPDGLHIIRPEVLGVALPALVGFAVAVTRQPEISALLHGQANPRPIRTRPMISTRLVART